MTKASDLHHDRLVAEAGRRLNADAALNNRDPILAVLVRHLPASGTVLEVGSGTGQHTAYFAPRFPALTWQPSDPNPEMRRSIAAFDRSLKTRNPEWGLREVEEVKEAAIENGLRFLETVDMPSNNLSVLFSGPLRILRA